MINLKSIYKNAYIIFFGFVFLAIVFLIIGFNFYNSRYVAKGFFYRTPQQLFSDKIYLVRLDEKKQRIISEQVWKYYKDEYPQNLFKYLNDTIKQTGQSRIHEQNSSFLENFGDSELLPPLISAPRKHIKINDIVAVVASVCMQQKDISMCHNGTNFFFFKEHNEELELIEVLPIGESPKIYESYPWGHLLQSYVK